MTGQDKMRLNQATDQFLHLCLRSRWDPTARQSARDLSAQAELDWAALRQVARAERLAPLLYAIGRSQDLFPAHLEEELRQAYFGHAARNIRLFHELETVLQHLSTAGLPVILLKGAALARSVYGNDALRPLGDLDLLVRQRDIPNVLRVLAGSGYEPIPPTTYRSEVKLLQPGPAGCLIEVHWGLLVSPYYQYILSMDWFWETARPLTVGPASVHKLGPEAQILYLCAHLQLHHGGEGLLWLHDIAEVTAFYQEQPIDWDLLLAQAQAYRLVLPTQQVLTRVREAWNAPIPAVALDQLQRLRPSREEEQVLAQLSSTQAAPGRQLWSELVHTPGWKPRLRFVRRSLLPPFSYVRYCYQVPHPLLVPLYYPYHWVRGLRRALSRAH